MYRNRFIVCTIVALVLPACTRPNPAFEGLDEDQQSEGDGDPGDGDGDPGEGDGDPGDGDPGDGDPGDGDGDGDPGDDCFVDSVQISADTFLQSGPYGQSCYFSWDVSGPPGTPCDQLNFGQTSSYWIGLKSDNSANDEGVSFYVFRAEELNLPEGYELIAMELVVYVDIAWPQNFASFLELRGILEGEDYSWFAGLYDGQAPQSTELASTYAYRIPEDAPWPEGGFHSALGEVISEAEIGGMEGSAPYILKFEPGFVAELSSNPGKFANGFALTSVEADGFDVIVESLDGDGLLKPYLEFEACPQ